MKHTRMKMGGKLIAMFALALALVGALWPEAGTVARADALASDGNGEWKYEIPSGENKTLDLTSDASVTSGFQFHLIAAGPSGSVHIQAGSGYVLRVQGNVGMNLDKGEISFYSGADSSGELIKKDYRTYSHTKYYDHSSSGNDLYIEYSGLGSPYFDFTVTVIDPATDLSFATVTGVDSLYLYTGEVLPVTCTVRDRGGYTLSEGTHYTTTVTRDGEASEIREPGDYPLTITAKEGSGLSGSKSVGFRVNKGLTSGAEANTYLISGQDDWKTFSELVAYGFDFSGKTVKLSADIDYIDINVNIGTGDHPFTGTFDGSGKKITINSDGVFSYINGATIQNLWADQGDGGNCVLIKYTKGSGRNVMKNVLFTTKEDDGSFCYRQLDSCTDVYGTFTDEYGNGEKVTATMPTESLYRPVTAANSQTYYIPATVSGMQEQYLYTGNSFWPDCLVTDTSGKVLEERTDYSVEVFAPSGNPVDGLEGEGNYTVKYSGMGDYRGAQSFACTVVSPSEGEINSWSALQAAMSGSGTKAIRLTGDIEASDSDSALTVPSGLTVNLDLAGHTIDRNSTAETVDGNVITVEGTLVITDSGTSGTITGGWNSDSYGGGIQVKEGGSLTLRRGTIYNNKAYSGGGGVYVEENGSFTMSGGAVSGNQADSGGGVFLNNGNGGRAFIMTGGTISGNAASDGGGVCGSTIMSGDASITGNTAEYRSAVYGSTLTMAGNASITDNHSSGRTSSSTACPASDSFYVSGSVRITGNTNGDGQPANCAVGFSGIRISGALTDSARIGVTSWSDVSSDAPLILTDGLSGRGNAGSFISDQGYLVALTSGGEAMLTGDTVTFYWFCVNRTIPYDPANDFYFTYQKACVERGERVKRPADPADPYDDMDLTFSGWFLDADCTEPFDFDAPVSGSFVLYPCWQKTLTAEDVSLADGTYTYSGEEIRPEITVSGILSSVYLVDDSNPTGTLTPDRDYMVEYSDNVSAGTATVTVTGKRLHTGTVTKTFEIARRALTAEGVSISLRHNGAEYSPSAPFTYDAQAPTVTVTDADATITQADYLVLYQKKTGDDSWQAAANATDAGTYRLTVTASETGNYQGTAAEQEFTIAPAGVTLTALSGSETYDGSEKTLTGFTGSIAGLTFPGVSASGSGTNAGKYEVSFTGVTIGTTLDGTGNYVVTGMTNGILTVDKAQLVATAPKAVKNPVFTGSEIELVTPGSVEDGYGPMYYAVREDKSNPQPEEYTVSIPKATGVGTYYVWYRVAGDDNHEDLTADEPIAVAIARPTFGTPDFTLPANLAAIDESAFEGVPSLKIVDAHSCASIGKDAFKGTGLTQIWLPKDCEINSAAFDEGRLIYVFAPSGSTTQSYCANHDNLIFTAR